MSDQGQSDRQWPIDAIRVGMPPERSFIGYTEHLGASSGASFKSSADKLRGHFTQQHDMLGVIVAHGEFGVSFALSPTCARTGISGVCGLVVRPTHRTPSFKCGRISDRPKGHTRNPTQFHQSVGGTIMDRPYRHTRKDTSRPIWWTDYG